MLGCETPLSVAIRRFLAATPEAAADLFGESRLPTLVQYDPSSRFFETRDGTLLFTAPVACRSSATTSPTRARRLRRDARLSPRPRLRSRGRARRRTRIRPLPFVFGRSHFTVSYFGANVYPENIAVALEQPPVCDWVTGKFVLQSREDDDRNRYLALVVELAPGIPAGEEKERTIAEAVVAALLRLNSEFANYVRKGAAAAGRAAAARDSEWFAVGVKHRYTRSDA